MPEPHRRGMQVKQLRRPIVARVRIVGPIARCPVPPISHDRMSRGRQMRAHLVVPPCRQPHAHDGGARAPLDHLPGGLRRERLTAAADAHLPAPAADAADRRGLQPGVRRRPATSAR